MNLAALRALPNATGCDACGASYAKPQGQFGVPKFGVCGNCWDQFKGGWLRSHGNTEPTENDFNTWLARKVLLAASRLEATGILGRCEALSVNLQATRAQRGYQCGSSATTTRDKRRVCARHGKIAEAVTYIPEIGEYDPYEILGALLKRLMSSDEKFANAVRSALVSIPQSTS